MPPVITITFGECAENHVGMQKLGHVTDSGMSFDDLEKAKIKFEKLGYTCEIYDLVSRAFEEDEIPKEILEDVTSASACVLVVRNGVEALLHGQKIMPLVDEQISLEWDTKAFMRGRVVNKHARHNLCYSHTGQEPCYEEGKGRVVSFDDVPLLNRVRKSLPDFFGKKTSNLYAEGNLYYDPTKCGIGFHGDSERRVVVAMRLGDVCVASVMPLHYQWFQRSKPIGKRVVVSLGYGDVYAMSEKAVGTDWKKKIVPTLRHATGCKKYTTI